MDSLRTVTLPTLTSSVVSLRPPLQRQGTLNPVALRITINFSPSRLAGAIREDPNHDRRPTIGHHADALLLHAGRARIAADQQRSERDAVRRPTRSPLAARLTQHE